MKRLGTLVGTGLLLSGLAAVTACAPLTVYNALAPADSRASQAGADIAYGPLPRQQLDVYRPVYGANQSGSVPVVVIIYGGSWNSGRRQDYAFLGKAIASRGFVAVVADYRLVPAVRFPAFLEDGARAVAWAHVNAASYGGDPGRIYLLGHSAGAYNAVMIALDPRYLRAADSDRSVIKGVAALAGPYDFLPLAVQSTKAAFGGAPDLGQTQPVNFVSASAPPMFLATGSDDNTVEPRNTRLLAKLLKSANVPVTTKIYPEIGHIGILLALSVPFRGRAPVLDDVARFIAAPPA